jgi:WD40 repeat protein/tetratricopeptide (TPR) repeat protein
MMALRPAFDERDQVQLIHQIAHQAPVPLRQHDRRIPRDLETIVHKVLAKDPEDRCDTAGELRDELRRFLDGRPTRWRRVGPAEQIRRWCKRNRGLAAASITAAVLTTVLAIGSTIAAWIYRDQLGRTRKAERQAQLALGNSLVSEGAALERTGLIGQRFISLDRFGQAARILGADPESQKRLPEIRDQAITALGLTDLRERRQHDCGDVFHISTDAALERYAVIERSGEVVVRRLDDDRELVRLQGPDRRDFWVAWTEFSPDGELLAACYGLPDIGRLHRIWHLGRRELLLRLSPSGPVFHPDARRLVYWAPEGGIAIWDRLERRVLRRILPDFKPKFYSRMAFDPQGRRLAFNNAEPEAPRVTIVDFETGRVLADWTTQVGCGGLAWSADGQLLAVGGWGHESSRGGSEASRVYVWNVRSGTLASVLQGHTAGQIDQVAFANSGHLLATASWDGTRLWDAASGEPLVLAPGEVRGFSPDDRRLAFQSGGKIGIWDVAAGTECRTLHPEMLGNRTERRDASGVRGADVSRDGRLVASCGDGVRLWEADTGRELAHLKAGYCATVLFHPDGQSLISAGKRGLYRWPIRPDPGRGADALRVGPPELLREAEEWDAVEWNRAAWLPDHRMLAFADNPGARILLVDSSHPHPAWRRAAALDAGGNHFMFSVAVSPDGRWLAAGGWNFDGIRVWDLRRRRLERILRPVNPTHAVIFVAGFSPDGRWLISCAGTGNNPCHFWGVGTWDSDPDRRIEQKLGGIARHPPAFTADGRVMALGIAPDQALLADAETGRELARLTTLQPINPEPLVFSPDGTKLVASTARKTALVWDLRRIRDHLTSKGLDWPAPPYPSEPAASDAPGHLPPPRPVRVVGEVIELQARRAGELAEMNRRLAARPDDAEALGHRGWLFIHEKRWPAAIADLERRLRLRPDDADACWLLAEAYHGLGNLARALAAINRLLERAPEDRDARFRRGLLAMAAARPNLAVDDFTRILAAEPELERARYHRARALVRLRRHREALADLDGLLSSDRNDDARYRYQLRSIVHEALGDRDPARADREKARALLPPDGVALNNWAWMLATGPIEQRDPESAVMVAQRFAELVPDGERPLIILGASLFHAGRAADAVPVLERGLAGKGSALDAFKGALDAFGLFFLAMAHHRLGHAGQARDCFDRAVRSWDEHKDLLAHYVAELTGLRAQGEYILGLTRPGAELPADVFAPE